MNFTIPYLSIFAGIVLSVWGIIVFFRRRADIARALQADGVVIELLRVRQSGEYVISKTDGRVQQKVLYRPRVRFQTQTGKTVEFSARVFTRSPRFTVGQTVKVLYDPHRPQQARINSWIDLWFSAGMLVFFGVFCIAMGLLGVALG